MVLAASSVRWASAMMPLAVATSSLYSLGARPWSGDPSLFWMVFASRNWEPITSSRLTGSVDGCRKPEGLASGGAIWDGSCMTISFNDGGEISNDRERSAGLELATH